MTRSDVQWVRERIWKDLESVAGLAQEMLDNAVTADMTGPLVEKAEELVSNLKLVTSKNTRENANE